jgi:hypothetical protein
MKLKEFSSKEERSCVRVTLHSIERRVTAHHKLGRGLIVTGSLEMVFKYAGLSHVTPQLGGMRRI